jgi:hypothetical protein
MKNIILNLNQKTIILIKLKYFIIKLFLSYEKLKNNVFYIL